MKQIYYGAILGLIAGIIFGFGLTLSDMVSSERVIRFFDIFGEWDPALIATMIGAILVNVVWNFFLKNLKKPIYAPKWYFSWSKQSKIDRNLVIWSILFGMGWGISGLCPGPAIANLWAPSLSIFVLLAAMIFAMIVTKKVFPKN